MMKRLLSICLARTMVITLRRHKEKKIKKGHLVTCKVWDLALYVWLHCSILKIFNIGRLGDSGNSSYMVNLHTHIYTP